MHISERANGDSDRLRALWRREQSAEQRDRYRAVALAIEGLETKVIQSTLERGRGFVQRWAYAYRDGGIEALRAKPRGGRTSKLPADRVEAFKARLEAGPLPGDGVCTLRGKDAQRILKDEFAVPLSLNGAYYVLHKLGYSCLKPRPRHEKNDPVAMEQFREAAPLLSAR